MPFFSKGKIWEVIGNLLKHLTNYAHLDSFGNWKKRALHQKKGGDVHVNSSQKLMEPLNLLQINHFSRKLLHSEIHPCQGRGSDNQPINFLYRLQGFGGPKYGRLCLACSVHGEDAGPCILLLTGHSSMQHWHHCIRCITIDRYLSNSI